MKLPDFFPIARPLARPQIRSLLGALTLFLGVSAFAHEGDVNSYGCHLNNENNSRGPCHCHRLTPDDHTKQEACDDLQPDLSNAEVKGEPFPRWRGIRVEYETECTDYKSRLYSYARYADLNIALELEAWYAPYEDVCYEDEFDVQIEHMVARKEAHVSGMCAEDEGTRLQFSSDLDNLTLASGPVNQRKSNDDAADWLPDHNECWYVFRTMNLKRKYDLSIDPAERDALQEVLASCSFDDVVLQVPQDCKDEFQLESDD